MSGESVNNPYSMTEETLRQQLRKGSYGRKKTQFLSGLLGSLASISFGTMLGWSSPILHFGNENNLYSETICWVASMLPLGCSIGIISCSYTIAKLGPKQTILVVNVFIVICWSILITSKEHFKLQMAGSFFLGMLNIAYLICGETLIRDTIHKHYLGVIYAFFDSSALLGVLAVNLLGFVVSKRVLTYICLSLPVLHFFCLLFMPESPVYLFYTSEVAAEKSLAWYRGRKDIYMSMKYIRKDYEYSRTDPETYRYILYSKVVVKGISIVIGLVFFQVFSGYFILIFYNIHIWYSDAPAINHFIDSLCISVALYVSNLFWCLWHNLWKFPVRLPLILGTFLSCLSLAGICAFLTLYHYKVIESNRWILLILTVSFIFFYDMSLNFYPKKLIRDYMPYQVCKNSRTIVLSVFWLLTFVLVKGFVAVSQVLPFYIVSGVLALILFIATLYCFLFVVETKNKSLVQIQLAIGGNPIGNRGSF